MDKMEHATQTLKTLLASLEQMKSMGGAGVLLPDHVAEFQQVLLRAQTTHAQMQTLITNLGQQIAHEEQRFQQDLATFRKFQ